MTMLLVDCLNQRVEDLELKVERMRKALDGLVNYPLPAKDYLPSRLWDDARAALHPKEETS